MHMLCIACNGTHVSGMMSAWCGRRIVLHHMKSRNQHGINTNAALSEANESSNPLRKATAGLLTYAVPQAFPHA
jgi:hypothetical protein